MADAHTALRRQRWTEAATSTLRARGAAENIGVATAYSRDQPEPADPPLASINGFSEIHSSPAPRLVRTTADSHFLEQQLDGLFSYPAPQDIVDDPSPLPGPEASVDSLPLSTSHVGSNSSPLDISPRSPPLDPDLVELLGFDPSSALVSQFAARTPYLPLLSQPSALYHTTFASTPEQMRYFNREVTIGRS